MKGTLTISIGISRLSGTRLMKGAKNNAGFGRATDFLQQDRQLKNKDFIEVDGTDDEFNEVPIILMTDARKASPQEVAAAAAAVGSGRKLRPSRKSTKVKKAGKSKKTAKKRSRKVKPASKK